MRTDPELAGVLRSHLAEDYSAALPVIRRAAGRGEVPAGAEEALARTARELIEAQLFRREAISRARSASAVRTIRLDEVVSSGDLGYALGTVVVRIPSGRELTTKYATIWQRDADGGWRLAVDSSSPNP